VIRGLLRPWLKLSPLERLRWLSEAEHRRPGQDGLRLYMTESKRAGGERTVYRFHAHGDGLIPCQYNGAALHRWTALSCKDVRLNMLEACSTSWSSALNPSNLSVPSE
jgi:hypothetical protein